MNDRPERSSDDNNALEAERIRARTDAAASVAAVKEFLGQRGNLVDVRGLSGNEQDMIRRAIVRYAIALRVLQESSESVMLKVRRLMEDGATPELMGARRLLVNEAVTWAMKAYFNATQREN